MDDTERIAATAFERVDLPVAGEFTISRGSAEVATNHLVQLEDGAGRVGVGGAAPSAYYGETPDSVGEVLPDLLSAAADVNNPHAHRRVERRLVERAPGEAAARAAVSAAVHDLAARQRGEPLYRRWGLAPGSAPATSYTVPIGSASEMAARARRLREEGFPILKVKLGTDDDRARLEAVREATPEARIRVDANGAWTPAEAVSSLDWLAAAGVELVEQPVAADDLEGLRRVSAEGPLPVAADESCVAAGDVPAVAGAADVVVVKLMKCGGLRAARRQVATAHAHGLDVMLGCMVESNASVAAACHLAPLAEYADLDGALLLASDPCQGVGMAGGRIDLEAVGRGTGARLDPARA